MPRSPPRAAIVVIGGSHGLGRAVALALGRRGDAVAVVYLHDQGAAEATVEEILGAGGAAIAVRADLADPLDVERVFAETAAMFGAADVVVDTTGGDAPHRLDRSAAMVTGDGLDGGVDVDGTVAALLARIDRRRARGDAP